VSIWGGMRDGEHTHDTMREDWLDPFLEHRCPPHSCRPPQRHGDNCKQAVGGSVVELRKRMGNGIVSRLLESKQFPAGWSSETWARWNQAVGFSFTQCLQQRRDCAPETRMRIFPTQKFTWWDGFFRKPGWVSGFEAHWRAMVLPTKTLSIQSPKHRTIVVFRRPSEANNSSRGDASGVERLGIGNGRGWVEAMWVLVL
jgi:hypothetical protein